MPSRRGWKVNTSFDLPEGFELREDPHFVYLYSPGGDCSIFSANSASPEKILEECARLR